MDHLLNLFANCDFSVLGRMGLQRLLAMLKIDSISNLSVTAATSFALIAAAEIGDKSQLVCMTLAARHRVLPILLGAISAFAFLNGLAVVFGVAVASWLPAYAVAGIVALLFAVFGMQSLRTEQHEDGNEEVAEKSGRSIFFSTFLLITVAEFGDKTQLAVVALSSTHAATAVWLGATMALTTTSALGIWAGKTLLQAIPLGVLHKISGVIFLALSAMAGYRAITSFSN